MRRYIARRLLYAIPTLLAISLATFLLTRLSPGDP
ncbi:MAG TPA: ABC transporter permease, partial [Candidatus Limnocylindria bacterium]